MTPRTTPMFRGAGVVYAYFSYGMHTCVNLVCGAEGSAAGILLRGGEVVAGEAEARRRRAGARPPEAILPRNLARGPACLAQALGVLLSDSGTVLAPPSSGGALVLEPAGGARTAAIRQGPRVGVSGPGGGPEFPWRFWIVGDPTVSTYRAAVSRSR